MEFEEVIWKVRPLQSVAQEIMVAVNGIGGSAEEMYCDLSHTVLSDTTQLNLGS